MTTVYVVRQTQLECGYENTAIAVFDDEATATKLARALNKEYGFGCIFDDDWDFVEYELDDCHYYDVDSMELNPNINDYL